MCTTMATAPIAKKDFWHFGGVSRIITVSYLRPIPKGITLLVKCKVVQIGKTNCK
jgi:acyl-coenzyme A thioesterase PaaI-like protein